MNTGPDLPVRWAQAQPPFSEEQSPTTIMDTESASKAVHRSSSIEISYQLFNNLLEGCQLISFDWRYLYLNEAAVQHGQYLKTDLLGYTMMECYPGIEQTALFATLQRAMHFRTVEQLENEFSYPNGTSTWFELRIQPAPEGILILSLDITDRKRVEAAERASADWVNLALTSTNLGTWQQHIATGSIRLDETARLQFGFRSDIVTMEQVLNQIHPDDRQRVASEVAGNIAPRPDGRCVTEYRVVHPDGAIRWLALQGQIHFVAAEGVQQPLLIFGTSQDITERKAAEKVEHEQRMLAEAQRDCLAVLTTTSDVETVLQQILAYSATVISSEAGTIVLFERDQGRVACARGHSPDAVAFFKTNLIPLGVWAYTQNDSQPPYYLAADTKTTPYWVSIPFTAWVQSSIGVQIVVRGEPIGLLIADSATPNRFQQQDVVNLQTFACYAALALENAQHVNQLEQRVQVRTAELQAAKARVEAILNNSTDGILLVDHHLWIQQTNASFDQLFGCTPNAYIGRSLTTLMDDEEVNTVIQFIATATADTKGTHLELRAMRTDGTTFDSELSIGVLKGGNIVCTLRDITERKAKEEILRRSEQQFQESQKMLQLVLDTIPVRVFWKNRNAIILGCNRLFAQDAGFDSSTDLIGKRHQELSKGTVEAELYHADDLAIMEIGIPKVEYEETLTMARHGQRCIQTSKLPLRNEEGAIIGLLGVYTDITARKEAEAALLESEARYRMLAENVTDVISKIDTEGICTFITPSCYPFLGYSPAELVGMPASDIVHPEDRFPAEAVIHQTLHTTKPSPTFSQRIRHKAGHYLWVEVTASIIRDPGTGQPVEILTVMRDITERKYAEIVLAARREEDSEFQAYLKELHEITIELTQIDDLDLFYRRVVEVGLARLGFERFALFRYDATLGTAQGTYGTDPQGRIVNEAHIRFTPGEHDVLRHAFMRTERFHYAENVILYDDKQQIGIGWNAAALLWNDNQPLGWLVADNLLQQKTASKPLLDTLGLYGLTVGTLLRQKQIQLALRESETRYRLLTENIMDVVIRFNTASEYIYVSPSSEIVLGYTPAELLGQSALIHVYPDDQTMVKEALLKALQPDPQTRNLVVRFQHKQGHYLWLEINGQVIHTEKTGMVEGVIISARDISARKAAEIALKESEGKYRHLIENMRGGLVVYDINGKLAYVNDRICMMLGYTSDEVIGSSAYDHPHSEAGAIIAAQFELRRQMLSSTYELTLQHKNGSLVHLLVSASPLVDKYGAFNGSLAVMTDITVQKQAEAVLRQALAKEKELGELKSRFVSMASHEFRTPLATILILTETLSAYRHKFTEEQIALRFDRIKEQISHLKGIMEDVLLLSRMQARRVEFNPAPLDLDAFCRMILDEFQMPNAEQTRLHYQSSGPTRAVQVDQKLMRQMISNLVSNALKYSPADKPIWVSLTFMEDAFRLQVRDEGIGIPAADLNHLFEPFHRATNVGAISGTGLGMVIAKEAVELHSGAITVESQVDQGTTCTIRIPLTTTPKGNASNPHSNPKQ